MSKLQAVNVLVLFSRAGDSFSCGPGTAGGSGTRYPEARAVSTAPPSPGLPFTTPHPARVLWATDSLISTEGGHLGGLTGNRGASPIIGGLGGMHPLLTLSPQASEASRIGKKS